MALNTATTTLNYGVLQVETATVVGTITLAGNATFTITGSGITGSPFSVPVALNDTADIVAAKAAAVLNAASGINTLYTAIAEGAKLILRKITAVADDATLNVAIANGTCTGLTAAPTSANTTAGVAFAKLIDILNYPDLGSAPSKLDSTTLSDAKYKTNILGLQETPDFTFECNYDEAKVNTIAGLTGFYAFQLLFGTTDGKFEWAGQLQAFTTGGGVDEVRKMSVVTSVSIPVTFATN
jgi:hypothetical protein